MTEHETTPPPEPCTMPPPAADPYAAWLAANGLTDQHEERPAEPAPAEDDDDVA